MDLLLWLLGDIEVLRYWDDSEGGDECERLLRGRLASGSDVTVDFSRARRLSDSVRVEGEKGFVAISLSKNQVLDGSPSALSFIHEGICAQTMRPRFVTELFEAEIRDFRDSIVTEDRNKQIANRCEPTADLIDQCYAIRQPLIYPWTDPPLPASRILPWHSRVLVTGATGFTAVDCRAAV